MILYGFYIITSIIIIILIIIPIIIIIIILKVGPHFSDAYLFEYERFSRLRTFGRKFPLPHIFSNVPFFFFLVLTLFQIVNVWPEMPATTEIYIFFDY